MTTWPTKKSDLEKWARGINFAIILKKVSLMLILTELGSDEEGNDKTYKPKKKPPVSADESGGISGSDADKIFASKKSKKPEKTKAKVNLKNDSVATQADKKNRRLLSPLTMMIRMSQLRMFKGQHLKPAKAQRRQFGLSCTGLLAQQPTRKSQFGNGRASTVCECPNTYSTKHLTEKKYYHW
jgi:hypothetical protein